MILSLTLPQPEPNPAPPPTLTLGCTCKLLTTSLGLAPPVEGKSGEDLRAAAEGPMDEGQEPSQGPHPTPPLWMHPGQGEQQHMHPCPA